MLLYRFIFRGPVNRILFEQISIVLNGACVAVLSPLAPKTILTKSIGTLQEHIQPKVTQDQLLGSHRCRNPQPLMLYEHHLLHLAIPFIEILATWVPRCRSAQLKNSRILQLCYIEGGARYNSEFSEAVREIEKSDLRICLSLLN